MTLVLGIIGLVIGATLGGWRNALFGAVMGLLAGELLAVKSKLRMLEQALLQWQEYFRKLESKPSTPTINAQPAPKAELVPKAEQPQEQSEDHHAPMPVAKAVETALTKSVATGLVKDPPPVPRVASPATLTSSMAFTEELAEESEQESEASNSYQYQSAESESPVFRWLREFFTGGNTLVRVGVVVLFFGVAFLLQYTAEHVHVPIQMRLMGVVAGAVVALILGWRLRERRAGFALALQGGATGVLYLVIFAGLRLYQLLPPSLAFMLLLAVVLLSGALAVLQNSIWLAVLGASGGFLAPILTSTGDGNHVALFSFYAILNVGILLIAWFKSWRALNLLGFAFTFVIGTAWGVLSYQPDKFATTEPFLVLFFLFYVGIALLYASKQAAESGVQLNNYVDGTLVFGVPIVAFGLQAAMLREQRFELAGSAVVVAAFYLILAQVLWRRVGWRLLVESFIALGITFATLAIPLAFNGHWSAATWALEGAALIWVGVRQSRLLPRLSGVALQALSALLFVHDAHHWFEGLPVLNSACLSAALVGIAGIVSSDVLYRYSNSLNPVEKPLAPLAFWWGLCWWFVAGNGEIQRLLPHAWQAHVLLAYLIVLAIASSFLCSGRKIRVAAVAAWLLLPVMIFMSLFDWVESVRPIAYGGWLLWPLAFVAWYWILYRHELLQHFNSAAEKFGQVFAAWLLLLLGSRQLVDSVSTLVYEPLTNDQLALINSPTKAQQFGGWSGNGWSVMAMALLPALYLVLWPRLRERLSWPIAKHEYSYLLTVGGGAVLWLLLWSVLTALLNNGNAMPLSYLPVLNPIDVTQLFVFLGMVIWWRQVARLRDSEWTFIDSMDDRLIYGIFGTTTFLWMNAVLLRTVSHWYGIDYNPHALWSSVLVQTSLSIFWTVLALTSMWLAARHRWRVLWFIGATLMGAELLKLFFVDLSNSGSVARIVSFLGVGLLVVLIGYVSPLPPQEERDDTDDDSEASKQ